MESLVGQKNKNWPEMIKNYFCASTPYLSKHTSFDRFFCCFFLHKFKMMTSPDIFFIFLKFWFSSLLGGEGVKKAKHDPKWQKILSNFVSQEPYLIWLWFLVHIDDTSSKFFHSFKSLIFPVFQNTSINAKRRFWGVSYLPHMFVVVFVKLWLILSQLELSRTELPKCTPNILMENCDSISEND